MANKVAEYRVPAEEFKTFLDTFSIAAKEYSLTRVIYSDWKAMTNACKNHGTGKFTIITYDDDTILIDLIDTEMLFSTDDNGFGGFLYKATNENWYNYKILTINEITSDYTINTIATLNNFDYDNYATTAASSSNYTWHNYDTTTAIDNYGSVYVTKEEIENMESSIAKLEDLIATKADKVDTYATALAAKADYMQPTTIDNNRKEDKFMKNFKFDFGPVNGNVVRMSMYGLAIQNKTGNYVSYDAKNGEIMDVDVLNFNGSNFLYKMPVAIKDITIGDVIVHLNTPMFVVGVGTDSKSLIAVDPVCGERKDIMLTKSPFGFNFATKIVNFLGNAFNGAASADNPFGNMWMLMAMNGDNQDMSDVLPYMMLANGGDIDPTMMMFMAMSGKGNNDMLPFLMMMNANKPAAACKCECTCGKE